MSDRVFTSIPEVLAYMTDQRDGDIRCSRSMEFYLGETATVGEIISESLHNLSEVQGEAMESEKQEMAVGEYEAHIIIKIRRVGELPIKVTGGFKN